MNSTKSQIKVLIIRFSSIGDIVLTSPVIRALKEQLGAEVHFITKKKFSLILQSNPHIDKLWTIENKVDSLLSHLKKENFDYIIDLHHNLRSARIKAALKAVAFSFDKINVQKWLMVNLKLNRLPKKHIVDRYMSTISSLGSKNDGKGLDFFIPADQEVDMPGQFKQAGIHLPSNNGYVALAIGAAHATKRLPPDQLSELCRQIPFPIALLGGPGDRKIADHILANKTGQVLNCCGNFNILQSASAVKQAKLVISHDTGLMHIACSFQKPLISIWGNTIPAFGMYPYYNNGVEKDIRFEISGLNCRPCSKIGYDACPKGHFKCMKDQQLEAISLAVKNNFPAT